MVTAFQNLEIPYATRADFLGENCKKYLLTMMNEGTIAITIRFFNEFWNIRPTRESGTFCTVSCRVGRNVAMARYWRGK
jgi:hypothetical protein